jgi:hypothetical protein
VDPTPDRLSREAAERILRRAVELADDPHDHTDDVPLRALIEAAAELDIDPARVRLALAEERLGLLEHAERRSDVVLGPDQVLRARVVSGSPGDVLDRVDAWMRRDRVLRRVRRSGAAAEYARRNDPAAAAQRAVRSVGGHERLAHVRRLRVLVAEAEPGRSLVGLLVDLHRSRNAAAAGGVGVAATGVATAGASALAWAPWAWIGVPVAAAGGVGVMAARKAYVADVGPELESVLDAVASGATPASVFDALSGRLLRSPRPAQARR